MTGSKAAFRPKSEPGARPLVGSRHMAATSHPLATKTALDLLEAGGTAVDAAIAANAMLGLVEPTGCGVGGDLFAIVWDPRAGRLFGLNGSGRAPALASLDAIRAALPDVKEIPVTGPWGVTVPGCVDAWFELHERFGRLDMEQLLRPTIRAGRDGFRVTPVIAAEWAGDLERISNESDLLQQPEPFFKTFAPTGDAPRAGSMHANPDLAGTLERIAGRGRSVFYTGEIAERVSASVRANGGLLDKDDLAAHRSEWMDPISISYRGFDVFELPPNSQGVTALQMLGILEGFDLSATGFGSVETLHLQIESKKLAFEDRARFIFDPHSIEAPVEMLLSPSRLALQRSRIDLQRAASVEDVAHALREAGDTCYLTTADADGMMVSLIQSNFVKLGSGIVPDGQGFCLQNRGALFALDPCHPGVIAPGKRPFHTIIPAFVLSSGRPVLSFGVMGGAMQPQGHVQILSNLFDFGMGLQEAGDAPRFRHTGSSRPTGVSGSGPGTVLLEAGFPDAVAGALKNRGHAVDERREPGLFGGYQAIAVEPGTGDYVGASESRKDGCALGR